MRNAEVLPWCDPVDAFAAIGTLEEHVVFLHSSEATSYSGRNSWLAWGKADALVSDDWNALEQFLKKQTTDEIPCFGYLAYEMLHGLEDVPACPPSPINVPQIQCFTPRNMWKFDHKTRQVLAWGEASIPSKGATVATISTAHVRELHTNIHKSEYLSAVEATREAILRGDFYQANLTRKFYGQFTDIPDGPALFLALLEASPAPYSAYLRFGDVQILSSSPELFLRAQADGLLETRPIKGTLRRGENMHSERQMLAESQKDHAENLMIVDLMRNDLARVAVAGTVDASRRFEVDSFRTVHHLSSTVSAKLSPRHCLLDAIKAAFPPGSMTGAPKIAAMRWCASQEGIARGVYSGVLGWIGKKTCELSVVIRTVIIQGNSFEFQVGGGIVADSEPLAEWRETITKARGLAQALGIDEKTLENL